MLLRHPSSTASLFIVCLMLICGSLTVNAQSGRRQQKPEPAAPIPTPTPEPTPIPQKKHDDPTVVFSVAMDNGSTMLSLPMSYYTLVQSECAEELRANSSAAVELIRDSMNRGEAYKRAKSESTANVVWLQLTYDSSRSTSSQSLDSLEIEYVVFAPSSGKTLTSGRGYMNSNRKGPMVIGPRTGTNNAIYAEQQLRYAAQDVADRILHALNLTVVSPIPNFKD